MKYNYIQGTIIFKPFAAKMYIKQIMLFLFIAVAINDVVVYRRLGDTDHNSLVQQLQIHPNPIESIQYL